VLGGGRYDGLMESLGGAPTPAVGWAAGIERLAMLVGEVGSANEPALDIALAVEDDAALIFATQKLAELRRSGFSVEMVASGSPKKRFDKAGKLGANRLVAIGFDSGSPTINVRGENADEAEAQRIHAVLAP
jgi:histidyl-tRNA synthetase